MTDDYEGCTFCGYEKKRKYCVCTSTFVLIRDKWENRDVQSHQLDK